MFSEDLEWCLKLSSLIGCNPRAKPNVWQNLYFLVIIMALIRVPVMTAMMFAYQKNPVTIKEVAEVSGNFTLFFHAGINMTTVFLKRSQIFDLLQCTKDKFWPMTDTEDIRRDLALAKLLNKNVFFNSCIILSSILIIKPLIIGGDYVTYKCYKPNFLPRYLVLSIENVTTVIITIIFVYFDLLISTLLTLMKIQFKMLNKKLNSIYQDGDDKIDENLKEHVDHYSFLIDFVDRFSTTFSTAIFLFIGTIILSLCICMYIMLEESANPKIAMEALVHLVTGLNEICICYSIPAQGFMNEANNVDRSIYFSAWYEHPKHARKILLTMTRGQKRIEITAGGVMRIDMNMFLVEKEYYVMDRHPSIAPNDEIIFTYQGLSKYLKDYDIK